MKQYTFLMFTKGRERVRSLNLPVFLLKYVGLFLLFAVIVFLLVGKDYYRLWQKDKENYSLELENRQLKDQIQIFQMKMNALERDLERIKTLEKKIRIATGLDKKLQVDIKKNQKGDKVSMNASERSREKVYESLQKLYQNKIASDFGLRKASRRDRDWKKLLKKSYELSIKYARFDAKFDRVKKKLLSSESALNQIDQHRLDQASLFRSTPSIIPTKGWITSHFGIRKSPYNGEIKMHEGIDVGAPKGTPIVSPADGIVVDRGSKTGYGKLVKIDHGYGIETVYAHAKKILVKRGDKVKRGDPVALVGDTGHATGPHLHYEVRFEGISVNPMYFILDRSI